METESLNGNNTNGKVRLVWITPDAEKTIAYCTRVSNFKNQDNPKYKGLLKFCIREGHWSPFEMGSMCLEIITTRAISAQIIRHRSFSFQEFSQRYSPVQEFLPIEPRRQDLKNRQNSTNDLSDETKEWFEKQMNSIYENTNKVYEEALEKGIAKESARFLLPLSSMTKLYMNGTIRSWIHYIQLREANGTQLEHMEIAKEAKRIFCEELPTVAEAVGFLKD